MSSKFKVDVDVARRLLVEPERRNCVPVDPKQVHGAVKPPLALVPATALAHCAMAMQHGAKKYGAYNWRDDGKHGSYSLMTYLHAMQRHIASFIDREDVAQDSGVHHLAHVMAGCAIVLDAASVGALNDDRPPTGRAAETIAKLTREAK